MIGTRTRWAGLAVLAALVVLVPSLASAQTGVMFVKNNRVGIGIDNPGQTLAIFGSAAAGALVQARSTDGTVALRTLFQLTNNGAPAFVFKDASTGATGTWLFRMGTSGAGSPLVFANNGSGVSDFRLNVGGNLTIAGNLTQGSSRARKQDFAAVDSRQILDKVAALPLSLWSYKHDPMVRHVGPMAEDFYEIFNVGATPDGLSSIDTGGVALAAIQGLNKVVAEKDARITELESRLESLERMVAQLAAQ